MTREQMTPGQIAYLEDCRRAPLYLGASRPIKRRAWSDLAAYERATWERNPTPREYTFDAQGRLSTRSNA